MAKILKGEELVNELMGREPLSGTIKLRERESDSEDVLDEFEIQGVIHAGGSCICYKVVRYFEGNLSEAGTLKEFYPVDSKEVTGQSYHLRRHDIDAGNLAKQLYSEELTCANFINGQRAFLSCYEKISALKEKENNSDSFFSPIRIYRGIPETKGSDNYTVYIYNPGDRMMQSFEDHLSEMTGRVDDAVKNPKGDLSLFLAYELHTVLQAIKALAMGIKTLHGKNLLHLDIKPSNFGIRTLGKNNGENVSVSLFDINTIYSRDNPVILSKGTPHFRAPEMEGVRFSDRAPTQVCGLSDVYSLGATLYNSIIISGKKRGLYDIEKFSAIDTELSHSLLMEYSEYNAKAELFDGLVNILKRSLARTECDYAQGIEGYVSVGEFIEDISSADLILTRQISAAEEAGAANKATLQIVNKEEYYEGKIDGGAVSAMQCLLYDYPLYEYTDSEALNVLVLGAGVFAQKFIDIALELSQSARNKGCYLNITVVSKEKEKDEARYLNARPEFGKFFRVNDEEPLYNEGGVYGRVSFVGISSDSKDGFSVESENNIEILKASLGDIQEKFGYVFISLSDENLNKKLACDLVGSDILSAGYDSKAIINFVSYKDLAEEDRIKEEKKNKGEEYSTFGKTFDELREKALLMNTVLNAVAVKNTLINHPDYNFLTRMALNCHLIWKNGVNLDMEKTYSEFRSAYNYTSSFANALSVKYKLKSLGLELSDVINENDIKAKEEKLRELTQAFRKKIGTDEKRTGEQEACFSELTMFEHRRWLTNMICSSSYRVLPQEEFGILRSTNKDSGTRRHTCILPSESVWALNKGDWKDKFYKWDEKDIEETEAFKKLDPLDRMSVMLHRHFMKKAKEFRMESVENDAVIIRRYLYDNPEALAAFNVYIISLRTILATLDSIAKKENINRQMLDIQQTVYKRNLSKFKSFLTDSLPGSKDIENRLGNIDFEFAPVIAAAEYTDYKAKDSHLIQNIPFVLNYNTTSIKLCIPFKKGRNNNEWFENIASAIVINPSMITYMVDIEDFKKIVSTLKDSLSNVTRVADNHNLQSKISLVIFTKVKDGTVIAQAQKDAAENELKEISERISSVDIVEIRNQKELVFRIRKTLETNQNSAARFSAIEINDEFISGAIYAVDDLSIPTYEFDSMNNSFRTEDYEDGYIWFSDIPFKTHLNMEDLFARGDRLSVFREPELHKDYNDIWNNCYFDKTKRVKSAQGWKALCAAIRNKIEADNLLMELSVTDNRKDKNIITAMFVPSFCRAAIERLFDFLSSSKIQLIEKAEISEHNSSMLKISFRSTEETRKAFLSLFNNPYALTDESKLNPIFNGLFVQIIFESLVVRDFSWSMVSDELNGNSKSATADSENVEAMECARNSFNYLVEKGYIIAVNDFATEEEFSFCFASSQIKELLSKEGQIVELYTYYKTIEKGYFDEIKTGLEVQRKRDDNEYAPTQEFDLVAIKGFRTEIVEVKARRSIKQEFYQKLKSNGDRFGINKELVLVSDLGKKQTNEEDVNHMHMRRGEEDYEVRTLTDIEAVADGIVNVMKRNGK